MQASWHGTQIDHVKTKHADRVHYAHSIELLGRRFWLNTVQAAGLGIRHCPDKDTV